MEGEGNVEGRGKERVRMAGKRGNSGEGEERQEVKKITTNIN